MKNTYPNVVTVVVTYNRLNLLKECLDALLVQSYERQQILVVDNASTDGTQDYVSEISEKKHNVIYYRLEKNIGGAGGFHEGMKKAMQLEADWVWLMDDDTIPEADALTELCEAITKIEEPIGYLSSNVYALNQGMMNTPRMKFSQKGINGYSDWNEKLADSLVKVHTATFCSIFICSDAIEKVGYPIKSYFIWGDDTEYTLRLSKYYGQGWLAGKSKVLHKRSNMKSLSIVEEDNANRVGNYFYYVRNYLINLKLYFGIWASMAKTAHFWLIILQILFGKSKHKWKKIWTINKGILSFWFGRYPGKEIRERMKKLSDDET